MHSGITNVNPEPPQARQGRREILPGSHLMVALVHLLLTGRTSLAMYLGSCSGARKTQDRLQPDLRRLSKLWELDQYVFFLIHARGWTCSMYLVGKSII